MNKLFLLLGKASSGKDTILKLVLEQIEKENLNVKKLLSNTTRPRRNGEKEGVEYHFTTLHEFDTLYKQEEIVEYAVYKVNNMNWIYFSTKNQLQKLYNSNLIKIINPTGFKQLKPYNNQIVSILIECPDEIRKERYIKRGALIDSWEDRLQRDNKDFLNLSTNYKIINDGNKSLDDITQEIINIIKKES